MLALLLTLTVAFMTTITQAMPIKRAGTQKFVVAHHMVGNTYPYTQETWANDIKLAHASGIDAFALNVGSDSWQPTQVANAFQAAQASGTGFKLFFSLDMTVLGCASPSDGTNLANWVGQYINHPNQFKYPPSDPKAFVSTFSGESCKFGQSSVVDGWKTQFKDKMDIHFVPSFFVDPATFGPSGLATIMDGAFQWNAAWSISTTTNSLSSLLASAGTSISSLVGDVLGSTAQKTITNLLGSLTEDQQYITPLKQLGGKTYMTSVSPWFFTHYSPQTFNKNWVYMSDNLYPTRWTSIVNNRDDFDLVEIITWNDYGESHYIGPIEGAQPNSQAWVDGMPHTAFLDMTTYYATAYKTGSYPAITDDKIYLWARTHPKGANAPDSVGKPDNFDMMQDSMFALVMATEPSTVHLSTNANGSGAKSFSVPAGVTQLQLPLAVGGTMRGDIIRDGKTIVTLQPSTFKFVSNPPSYNFNVFADVASTADS